MTLSTTQDQIELMQAVCDSLNSNPLIENACVDDWGAFGNFSLILTPVEMNRSTTTRLKALLARTLRNLTSRQASLRAIYGPDPMYVFEFGHRTLVGHTRSYWVCDVDFNHYDSDSNRFS